MPVQTATPSRPQRKWINQPSTLQPLHHLNGVNVLAVPEYGDTWTIYFLSGDVISQQAPAATLSDGWRPHWTPRRLKCSRCGGEAGQYRQWPNQDTGWGICRECVDWLHSRGNAPDEIRNLYGDEGVHYAAKP